MKHTPEPWRARKDNSFSYSTDIRTDIGVGPKGGILKGEWIAQVGYTTTEKGKANAERIVTCVNACAGINPEAVKDLLEALKVITDVIRKRTCGIALGKNEFYMQDEVDNAFIKADEAIAKAEAKQ